MTETIESYGNIILTRNHFTKPHLRLETFKNQPPHPLFSNSVLSVAGFYIEDTELVCYRCGLKLSYNSLSASTFRSHKLYSTICAPFQPADDILPEVEEIYIQEKQDNTKEIDLFPIEPVKVHEKQNESANAMDEILHRDKHLVYHLLKKENIYLRKKTVCCSCESEDAQYIILPCGHLGFCKSCIKTIDICPLCNVDVLDGQEVKVALQKEEAGSEEGIKFVLA